MGFRLDERDYVEISALASGGIPAVTLGLEFHLLDEGLGIYDPQAREWLKTEAEAAEERAEDAEAEIARLQEELERLKARLQL